MTGRLGEERHREQAGGGATRDPPVDSYRRAFKSRNVVLLCLQYLLWSVRVYGFVFWAAHHNFFAFIPEFLPQNVSGSAIGLINSFGALGGFAGAYVVGWLQGSVSSGAAFIFMAGSLLAAAILTLFGRRAPRPETRPGSGGRLVNPARGTSG